jgi:type I restriction enzyme R subunit
VPALPTIALLFRGAGTLARVCDSGAFPDPHFVPSVSESSIEFFAPKGEIIAHERRLPHWQQGGVAIFVTWRLADALPTKRLAAWRIERETWLAQHPKPWSTAIQQVYADRFEQSVDRWLDAGYGACLLRNPAARSEAVRALQHFDGS